MVLKTKNALGLYGKRRSVVEIGLGRFALLFFAIFTIALLPIFPTIWCLVFSGTITAVICLGIVILLKVGEYFGFELSGEDGGGFDTPFIP